MRRSCLFILFISAFPFWGHAQFGNESPIPYFRYSVTAGLGPTLLYGDLEKRQVGGAVYLRGNYFLTHGVSLGLELQEGLLRGKDENERRKATNLFHTAVLGVNFQPIKFLQDDHLRRIEYRESFGKRALNSIYVGAGMGVLYSLQWEGQRTKPSVGTPDNGNSVPQQDLIMQGRKNGVSYLVSTNVGIELPLHSLKPDLLDSYVWNLVVNGQLNFSLDDELDGYSGAYEGNEHRDVYGLLSIGVNLRF
ncbi:hypothetical protein [Parapedobacter defluvii]|uniref:hypothetical protein n=1 Tax=Parapedobacter defluvii TaxID=2045106 RepID=UPI000F96892C|nr:MAG: hypothetical protein EAS52_19920 [Parapedobacter sp.]